MMPTVDDARRDLARLCPEPIEAAVFAHKDPDNAGLKRLFGAKPKGPKLRINNWLVLTTTSLRIYALGGRSGTVPKEELGAWPREAVSIEAAEVDRSSYMASVGSSMNYVVYRLHITGPDTDFAVDVRMAPGAFGDDRELLDGAGIADEADDEAREGLTGLHEVALETRAMLDHIVAGCGPRGT